MPTKEEAKLQHSREFVEEQDAAVMRQTTVAKGDFHLSRRCQHPDLNVTKSDVKVTMKICSGSPARSVRNSHPMPFFTPDSGGILDTYCYQLSLNVRRRVRNVGTGDGSLLALQMSRGVAVFGRHA